MTIISYEECCKKCNKNCTSCPDCDLDCANCQTHCSCCTGPFRNLCSKCPEEDCDNRTQPYDPSAVSKEEQIISFACLPTRRQVFFIFTRFHQLKFLSNYGTLIFGWIASSIRYERRITLSEIISYQRCKELHPNCSIHSCPYPRCPNGIGKCQSCCVRCPCCSGARNGFCYTCSVPNCHNRNAEYIP